MATHKQTCTVCGEQFTPTKEEIELFEASQMDMPTMCEDCWETKKQNLSDFSDGDDEM